VSDNGDGISEEYIEKNLFKPFKTTKKKGLGIGLYQCKSIVEAHGGDIMVKSSKGCGTDFTVYIPLVTSVQNNTSVS
jgi:signal transduction histidine kinase